MKDISFRDSKTAFNYAITKGVLSEDSAKSNYAGNYMYMHSNKDETKDFFKHIDTRKYLEVEVEKESK